MLNVDCLDLFRQSWILEFMCDVIQQCLESTDLSLWSKSSQLWDRVRLTVTDTNRFAFVKCTSISFRKHMVIPIIFMFLFYPWTWAYLARQDIIVLIEFIAGYEFSQFFFFLSQHHVLHFLVP